MIKLNKEEVNSMSQCSYCGRKIAGEGFNTFAIGGFIEIEGSEYLKVVPEIYFTFCCEGCAWAFEFESHRRWYAMGNKEVKQHLINELRLSPGKSAGKKCKKCSDMLNGIGLEGLWGRA
jgi:hypothetical protein